MSDDHEEALRAIKRVGITMGVALAGFFAVIAVGVHMHKAESEPVAPETPKVMQPVSPQP